MSFWLVKSEPSTYSFDDLLREESTVWSGVTNNTALMHLRAMKAGDTVFVYHSGDERSIVGLARVKKGPYADPEANDPKRVVVDLSPVRKLPQPVTLSAIRQKKEFAGFDLVRISRLSVMPVGPEHAAALLTMAGEKPSLSSTKTTPRTVRRAGVSS